MKLISNSVLITLGILVSTSTVLAQPLNSSQLSSEVVASEQEELPQAKTTSETSREDAVSETQPSSTQATSSENSRTIQSAAIQIQKKAEPILEQSALESISLGDRHQMLVEADRLYLSGDVVAAARLYRQVKEPFQVEVGLEIYNRAKAIYDPAQLNPAGAVYWRLYQQGLNQPHLKSKTLAPLKLLSQRHPEFIPGHLRYAEALENYEQDEQALQVLQRAIELYPNQAELVKAKIKEHEEEKDWIEASLTARRFALFNFESPQVEEFIRLADENMERYQDDLREQLTLNAIGNAAIGTLGYVLTGSLVAPFSALQTSALLLRGESSVGESISNQLKRQTILMEDKQVLEYVQNIGNKLAEVTGRDEFNYEFYLIMNDRLNAFALPGGKIYINVGSILKTNSEAELAGLLAHEIAHSVLSHGFQLMTQQSLTANVSRFIPYVGSLAGSLLTLNYSREMERQADVFGTRMLVTAGYAADGVRNLMVTINEKEKSSSPAWLSTHPETQERVRYLETLIASNNLNRYAYEGVSEHEKIKQRVAKLWKKYESSQEYRRRNRTSRN